MGRGGSVLGSVARTVSSTKTGSDDDRIEACDCSVPIRPSSIRRKLHGYLLSPTHPIGRFKARFFAALGYAAERWPEFEADIRAQHLTQDAELSESLPAGRLFTIRAILKGRNGQ